MNESMKGKCIVIGIKHFHNKIELKLVQPPPKPLFPLSTATIPEASYRTFQKNKRSQEKKKGIIHHVPY